HGFLDPFVWHHGRGQRAGLPTLDQGKTAGSQVLNGDNTWIQQIRPTAPQDTELNFGVLTTTMVPDEQIKETVRIRKLLLPTLWTLGVIMLLLLALNFHDTVVFHQ
uniref:Uncharacterized protein n=1 Tax=Salvator merianae TaxID=96440 RepID=A0A8D0CDE2_SALMN